MSKIKSIIIVLLILITSATLFSFDDADITFKKNGEDVTFTISEDYCLKAIADSVNMPIKKLKYMLSDDLKAYGEEKEAFAGLKSQNRSWDYISIKELNIEPKSVVEHFNNFTDSALSFGGSVTLVGILVVFFSLVLISVLIAQFQHLDKASAPKPTKKPSKKTTVATPVGKVSADSNAISSNAIVAVITALHKHKMLVEERRRIQMTFSRTPVNMWSASNKMSMPNLAYKKPERNK